MCGVGGKHHFSTTVVVLLTVIVLVMTIESKLRCKSCAPRTPQALATVLAAMAQVPDQQVCVWHVGSGGGSYDWEGRLIKVLVSSFKTFASFKSDQVDAVPPICRQSVLVPQVLGCRGLLAPYLPLSTEHHFHVLVPGLLDIDELGPCSGQFGNARAAFISLRDARVFSLNSPLFPPRNFAKSNLSYLLNAESDTLVHLNGKPIGVATFNCPPFVDIPDINETGSITGIEWEVVKGMARVMNFTIKLVNLKGDRRWGYLLNGTWTGGITRAIYDGEAEIGACNMWYTVPTYQIMDFGHPLNDIRFTFIVPRPKPLQRNWSALVQVFDTHVWILVVASYLFYSIFYWSFSLVNHSQISKDVGVVKTSLLVFGMLVGTTYPPQPPHGRVRHLVTWWCMFGLLLSSTYNTSIASRLTLQGYELRLNTIQQLLEHNLHWTDHPSYSRERRSLYFNFANNWQKEWELRYEYITSESMRKALDSGKFAFPIQRWGERLLFLTVDGLDNENLQNMRVLKETTASTFESIKFAKRSPLYQAFQVALLRVLQAGLVRHWTATVSRSPDQQFARGLLQEGEDRGRADARKLSMANMSLVFFVLVTGLSASTVVFIFEIFCKKNK